MYVRINLVCLSNLSIHPPTHPCIYPEKKLFNDFTDRGSYKEKVGFGIMLLLCPDGLLITRIPFSNLVS